MDESLLGGKRILSREALGTYPDLLLEESVELLEGDLAVAIDVYLVEFKPESLLMLLSLPLLLYLPLSSVDVRESVLEYGSRVERAIHVGCPRGTIGPDRLPRQGASQSPRGTSGLGSRRLALENASSSKIHSSGYCI